MQMVYSYYKLKITKTTSKNCLIIGSISRQFIVFLVSAKDL